MAEYLKEKSTKMQPYLRKLISSYVTCILVVSLVSQIAMAQNSKKPNILFVMSDQWRKQAIGFMNEDPVLTPNLDEFSKEAIVFRNAVTNRPICTPSRACMLTGQYPVNNAVLSNGLRMSSKSLTLGDIAKKEGYSTAYIGKWHLDGKDEGYVPPERRHGFDYWIMSNHHNPFGQKYYIQDDQKFTVVKNSWEPDWITDKAIDYLKTLNDKPFCMVVSYGPPHTGGGSGFEDRWQPGKRDKKGEIKFGYGYAAPEKWEKLYAEPEKLPRRKNVKPVGKPQDPSVQTLPGYFGAISSIDHNFGRMIKFLKDKNMFDNTIIVFTSDHGEMLGSHGRMTKGIWYEESVGIPCLISYKNKVKPMTMTNPFSTVDMTPTILGLAGIKVPEMMDGYDFSKLMEGKNDKVPEFAFCSFDQGSPNTGDRSWRSVYTTRYIYILAKPEAYKSDGINEDGRVLYDKEKDPYQTNPIYKGMGYDDKMDELHEILIKHLDKTNDPFIALQWKTDIKPKYFYTDAFNYAKTPKE